MSEEQVTQEQTEQPTQETQQTDSLTPEFKIPTEALDFVGEGKKYKSAEDALKSVPHAQQHISTLEAELAQMKEELTKRRTAEELLDEIKSGIQPQQQTESVGIDQDRLMQMVNQTLEQKEKQTLAQKNASQVASKFTENFGSEAENVYNRIAKEAGLTVAQLNNLAATSPSAVLKLSGLDSKPTTVSKPTGSVNTQALDNSKPQELSARVPKGASTKDLVSAWKAAGEKVKSQIS